MSLRFGRLLSAHRRLVVATLVGVTMFVTGATWALSSPAGSSPDDDFHLPSIWCGWGSRTWRMRVEPTSDP